MAVKKIRILLVDDQVLILEILKKGLSRNPNIEVVGTATNGFLAFNEVNRVKPDVILLDMEMPTMNGIQFLQRLMPINPIPTIVLSALTAGNSKVTQDAFEAGAIDFMPKPSGGTKSLPALFSQLWTKIKMAAAQDVSYMKKQRKSYKDIIAANKKPSLASTALDRKAVTDNIILGMGAFDVSNDPTKTLKIFALGSCVGVSLLCSTKSVAALCHVVLPSSSSDKDKSINVPGYFADTAIPAMLKKLAAMGCSVQSLTAKIAGGAKTKADVADYFAIGQRNAVAVKATLLKHGIKITGEDTGKNMSRTVMLKPGAVKVILHHPEIGTWEI